MDITNQIFEPRYRTMESEYEDLLYGVDLVEGMIVLLFDPLMKGDPDAIHSDYDRMHLLQNNRWCEVTQLKITTRYDATLLVSFIGVYRDGTKMPRTFCGSYTWLVKKP